MKGLVFESIENIVLVTLSICVVRASSFIGSLFYLTLSIPEPAVKNNSGSDKIVTRKIAAAWLLLLLFFFIFLLLYNSKRKIRKWIKGVLPVSSLNSDGIWLWFCLLSFDGLWFSFSFPLLSKFILRLLSFPPTITLGMMDWSSAMSMFGILCIFNIAAKNARVTHTYRI